MMAPETLAAYAVAIASVVTALIQLIKPWLIDPYIPEPGRTGVLRLLSMLLNFGGLTLVLVSQGAWDWANLFAYIAVALGQTGVSHVGYKFVTQPPAPAPKPAVGPTPPASPAGQKGQTVNAGQGASSNGSNGSLPALNALNALAAALGGYTAASGESFSAAGALGQSANGNAPAPAAAATGQ
jgi:hypothetical protein